MTNESPTPSRRQFLGAAAGTAAAVATAGCLDSVLGASTAATEIEPEEPSDDREGTPEEFYYFLEANGIAVDELLEDDDELYLTYESDAETVDDSDGEIMVIYEVYKQALIHRGSEIEFLYAEISNPIEEQALGWGIDTEWVHEFDTEDGESDDDEPVSDADGNETADNETDDAGIDMNQVTLWNNIMNSKVYAEDLEEDDSSDFEEGLEEAEESEDTDDDGDDSDDGYDE